MAYGITIHLHAHGTDGRSGDINVDEDGDVQLTVLGEVEAETETNRSLSPQEARSLAAALVHFAAEVDRRR